jgi:hypothetical protein
MLPRQAQAFFAIGRGKYRVAGFYQRSLVGDAQKAAVVNKKNVS